MAPVSKQHIRNYGKGLTIIFLLLVLWGGLALVIQNNYILPPIRDILVVLLHPMAPVLGGETLVENTMVSLREVLTGFFAAVAVGIPVGLLIGSSAEVRAYLDPAVQVLRPVPPIAWMPFAIAWFAIGFQSVIFIIFMGAFFPILISTTDAVHSVRRQWVDVAVMFRATGREQMTTVILPGSMPVIWSGLRVAFGVAWMCVVAAEMLPGTSAGLGFLIMYAYNLGQLQVIGAGMVIIGVIGLGADAIFRLVQARFFFWQGRD
jgi:NitT/TauT family transport system permease protein